MALKNIFQKWAKLQLLWSRDPRQNVISDLLSQADSKADLHERMLWLESVVFWLKVDGDAERTATRFRFLFQVLEQNPRWRENTREAITSVMKECSFLQFFTQTGFTIELGLWTDVGGRLLSRFVPASLDYDFQSVLLHVFTTEEDAKWIESLPLELFDQINDFLVGEGPEDIWINPKNFLREGSLMLGVSVAHHGLTSDVRLRLSAGAVSKSPFLAMGLIVQKEVSIKQKEAFQEALNLCRHEISLIYLNMETAGVSVALVHKLEVLSASLDQIEMLYKLQMPLPMGEKFSFVKHFISRAVLAGIRGKSVRGHLNRHFYLLSRKISERNGYSGEHYISHSKSEHWQLFNSAIGGGVVVVSMTIFKTLLVASDLAPLFLSLGIWIVYSLGFLSMQFFDFTLATKLPSFTATHLARKLKESRPYEKDDPFYDELWTIVYSQLVAFFGNIVGLVPVALLVDWALIHVVGKPLMNDQTAVHTFESLHPFKSTAIFLGALTGFELWLSSICGGWFENWIVFKKIPEIIFHNHRLRKVFGIHRAKSLADFTLKNASGVASNVSLAFLFGFVPLFGLILGMNLESKHVTIATTGAFFALSSQRFSAPLDSIFMTAFGLFLVGLMNFLVSFWLALRVAMRAQNVERFWLWYMLRTAFLRTVKRGVPAK